MQAPNRRDMLKGLMVAPFVAPFALPSLGGTADAGVVVDGPAPSVAPEMVEYRAIVFRCGDYSKTKGFAITADEFRAANPPGTEVPFGIDNVSADPGSIFGDMLDGTAFDFDLDGDEVRCTIRHRAFLLPILNGSRAGFSAFFSRESKQLTRIAATTMPTIRGTRIIG